MQERARGALMGFVALLCFLAPIELSAAKQEIRTIEASAYNPSSGLLEGTEYTDRKQIDIEPSYTYVSHDVSIISANPTEEDSGKWAVADGLIKDDNGRIQSVWVEVKARNKGLLGDTVQVRARLTVIVEKRNES